VAVRSAYVCEPNPSALHRSGPGRAASRGAINTKLASMGTHGLWQSALSPPLLSPPDIRPRAVCREHAPREPLGATYDRHSSNGAPKVGRLIVVGWSSSG